MKVSIIVPTYNHDKYLYDCIISILDSVYQNFEIIIADDCSKKSSQIFLDKIEKIKDSRIIIIRNKKNMGLKLNIINALNKCSGDLISFFSGDDIMHPNKLKIQVKLFDENPKLQMSGHSLNLIDANGKIVGKKIAKKFNSEDPKDIYKNNFKFNAISIVYRNSPVIANCWDSPLFSSEKWVAYNMLKKGSCIYLDQILANYRIHNSNITKEKIRFKDDFLQSYLLIKDNKRNFFISLEMLKRGFLKKWVHDFKGRNYLYLIISTFFCSIFTPIGFIKMILINIKIK